MATEQEIRDVELAVIHAQLSDSPGEFAQALTKEGEVLEPWLPYRHLQLLNAKLVQLTSPDPPFRRLLVTMPPQHGKSMLSSLFFPAWFLYRNPRKRVMICSYSDDYAAEWGGKVRNLFKANEDLLHISVSDTSKAADRWDIANSPGGVKTAGVGGQITGRGAHLMVVDDPFKDAEEADSPTIREKRWTWWNSTAQSRLRDGAVVVLIQCMTGDTPVLMANGVQKQLRDVRPGDSVATYDGGRISTSTVRNWANQGPDSVFEIRMTSGRTVRANARHPFLTVAEDGTETWERTESLRVGTRVRSLRGLTPESTALSTAVKTQPDARVCAHRTTTRLVGHRVGDHRRLTRDRVEMSSSASATGLVSRSTRRSWPSKVASVLSAGAARTTVDRQGTGRGSSASITATKPTRSGVSSATTATSWSVEAVPSRFSSPELSTYAVTRDTVAEVVEVGVEDVYDIQVDRTENFIANGLVSHNTRWHDDDLAGRVIAHEPEKWEILNLPALAEENDAMGREPGEVLCPELFPPAEMLLKKESMITRSWTALYQQRPTPEGGGAFKEANFQYWSQNQDEGFVYRLDDRKEGIILVPQDSCWRFITADLAATARTSSDYTVASIWDVAPYLEPSRLILRHVERLQIEGAEHMDLFERLWKEWNPSFIGIEEAMQGSQTIALLRRKGIVVIGLHHRSKDKEFRAKDAQALSEMRRVYWPRMGPRYPWVADWEREHLLFPAAAHDDQVDTFSYAAQEVLRGVNMAKRPKPKDPETLSERAWANMAKKVKAAERARRSGHPVLGR